MVHVGPEGLHAEGFDLPHEFGELVGVALFGRQHGGHELDRVVGLQVGGAIREDRVGGGVRLVEAVFGELLQGGEDLLGLLLVDVVGRLGALDEDRALLLHLLADLLAHRATEHVGAAEGVAGDHAGGFHHLFLVDQDAVGLLGHLLEERVRVFDVAGVVLPLDVVRDELHGARTIERDERDDLVDLGDVELTAERLHAAGFELEHADGLRLVEEGEGLGVLEADLLDVEIGLLAMLADEVLGVVDDGERLEAQEVHLQEAELLDGVLGVLGRQVAFLHRHRDDVREGAVGDDHTARVLAGITHHALDDAAGLDDAGGLRVDADLLAELVGFLQGVLERDVDVVGDELGEAVGLDERQVPDAGQVADDHLGAERAEGDDVGDAVLAVFLAHVADDLVAATHAEVDVEVGRGDALRIQEALEEQAEADRVDVGDLEAIRHDRAGARAAARADGDVLLARPVDEVPDDEEVVDEARAGDDAHLVVDAATEFGGARLSGAGDLLVLPRLRVVVIDTVTFLEAGLHLLEQVGAVGPHAFALLGFDDEVARLAGGDQQAVLKLLVAIEDGVDLVGSLGLHAFAEDVDRVVVLADRQLDVAHLGDGDGVLDRFGDLAEDAQHLGFALQVELRGGVTHAALIGQAGAGLDAEHRVVGDGIAGVDVVDVVGGDDAELELAGELEEVGDDALLLLEAVVHELDDEVLAAEDLDELAAGLAGGLVVAAKEGLGNDALEAAGEADQAVGVLGELLEVGARLVVQAPDVRVGDELGEVLVAFEIPGEHAHVEILVLATIRLVGERVVPDEVELAAEEGLELHVALGALLGFVPEIEEAEEVAVVGDRHRAHVHVAGALHQAVDATAAIEHAVVRMHVEVHEVSADGFRVGHAGGR